MSLCENVLFSYIHYTCHIPLIPLQLFLSRMFEFVLTTAHTVWVECMYIVYTVLYIRICILVKMWVCILTRMGICVWTSVLRTLNRSIDSGECVAHHAPSVHVRFSRRFQKKTAVHSFKWHMWCKHNRIWHTVLCNETVHYIPCTLEYTY